MNDGIKINPYYELKSILKLQLDELNKLILKVASSKVEIIPEIINHLTGSGGKRIRPLLTLACAKLIGGDNPNIVKLAASVEFIHTATLFHDDVIDESELRRGKKTAKTIWGNKASILIGDFLLSHAFKLMVESKSIEALQMLAETSILITEAEVWQLDLIGKVYDEVDNYIKLIIGKTATLFASSCVVAGIINNANKSVNENLYDYGLNLGILFQITDDLLDYLAEEKVLGKKIGSDFLEKKMTLPLILLLKCACQEDREVIIENFNLSIPDIELILRMINTYNIPQKIQFYIDYYHKLADIALMKLPSNEIQAKLHQLLNYVTSRVN